MTFPDLKYTDVMLTVLEQERDDLRAALREATEALKYLLAGHKRYAQANHDKARAAIARGEELTG